MVVVKEPLRGIFMIILEPDTVRHDVLSLEPSPNSLTICFEVCIQVPYIL